MNLRRFLGIPVAFTLTCVASLPVSAGPFFSTGDPDGKIATATRPDGGGKFEIESADDFVIGGSTKISSATFTGLLVNGAQLADVSQVVVEIYRVFPKDSTVPDSGNVPTRVNSPSDVAFDSRDSASGGLKFAATTLSPSFSALNSVEPGGIHPKPGQTTLGDGPVTGVEVKFEVKFAAPFDLPADHYFFVPQVAVIGNGEFLWLSAPKPIVPPGTPFPPGITDLQSWTRDAMLDPDWLRVGTDIVGGNPVQTFNSAFSLTAVPEPATFAIFALSALSLVICRPMKDCFTRSFPN